MRLKYYKKLIGQMNVQKSFVLSVILVTFVISFVIYGFKEITPTIKIACESKARAVAMQTTEETVKEFLNKVEYDSLINLTYNEEGKIVGMTANIIELNKLSSEIAYDIQEKLLNLERVEVKMPIGKLLKWSMFSGYGPDIKIKIVPMGNIITDFKTEFVSEGINQTRHTIYIDITSSVTIVAPFTSDTVTSNSTVTIAETVIVGDIPDTYYNIENLKDATESGIMDTF